VLKNRSFLKGLGSGFIAGAMLLQLMLMVRDADSRIAQPEEAPKVELTAKLVKEKADSLNLQVYDKGIALYDQKQLDAAVQKAMEAARAEAGAAPAGPKQINIYIPVGMTAVKVVEYLYLSGVVVDRLAFEQAINQRQLSDKIRSGLYTFNLNEKLEDVIVKLTTIP
jgi:hypothetical protein